MLAPLSSGARLSLPGFSTNFVGALLALAKGTETLKQHWHCDANMSCICFVLQLLWLLPALPQLTN